MNTLYHNRDVLEYGPFRLHSDRRALLVRGVPVALTPRNYDILEFLVRNADRAVGRDEIVAHVWRGVTVGENNLSVQISALRQALAGHLDETTRIVSLPNRCYRLVTEAPPTSPATEPPPPAIASKPHRRSVAGPAAAAAALLLMAILAVAAARFATSTPEGPPEWRLSIGVDRFTAIGDQPASQLAAHYGNSVLTGLTVFGDLMPMLAPTHPERQFTPHFHLDGSVEVRGRQATVTMRVTRTSDGVLLGQLSRPIDAAAPAAQQDALGMRLLFGLRHCLFDEEERRRAGAPARDALDLLVDAHIAAKDMRDPADLTTAIAYAERSARLDPGLRPARVLLAVLLASLQQVSPAGDGDAAANRALALIDAARVGQTRNFLLIQYRAFILLTLGRLDAASATTELGRSIEPGFYYLDQLYGEILLRQGRPDEAEPWIVADNDDPVDDRLAFLSYAQGKYRQAIATIETVYAATSGTWDEPLDRLIEVAAMMRLGEATQATALMTATLPRLPPAFRHAGALRPIFFDMPSSSWGQLVDDLEAAGLPR